MQEQVNHTPAWVEWLKRPENLMTGLVLAAGLTQPRQRGEKPIGQLGRSAVAALGFRGGLEAGVQAKGERDQARADEQTVRREQARLGQERIDVERESQRIQQSEGAATRATQEKIAGTPRPNTPGEEELLRQQAGYYGRMPAYGSGKDPNDPNNKFKDPIEEMIATKFIESRMAADPAYVVNPIEVLQHLQPYRNARVQVDAMRNMGLMGEIVQGADGNYKVRVTGVSDPTTSPVPAATAAPEAPVTLQETPTKPAGSVAGKSYVLDNPKAAEQEEASRIAQRLEGLDRLGLERLLRAKDTDRALAREIRKRLAEISRSSTRKAMGKE